MKFARVTPMELDVQLQVAELIFKGMLEGKEIQVNQPDDLNVWYKDILGPVWIAENEMQRKEIAQQLVEDGENTPFWTEASFTTSEIVAEVMEAGRHGERVRQVAAVNRTEVVELLKELGPKVRESYYARCGAGCQFYGIRALIAIFRLFPKDSEVLDQAAECIRWIITDNVHNRNGLTASLVPMPPLERGQDHVDRGWSFLRAALDAFAVQLGAQPFAEQEVPQEIPPLGPGSPALFDLASQEVAVKIAECIVAAKDAPALRAQLGLLREAVPESACQEWKELKQMLPAALVQTEELLKGLTATPGSDSSIEAIRTLAEMLRIASTA